MYKGSCHCGNVRFHVLLPIDRVISCNCSHCQRKGFLLAFVPESQIEIEPIKKPLTRYQFHKKEIMHDFCPTCGVQCFGKGAHPADGSTVYAVNVRTLEEVDLAQFPVDHVDGKSM